jgi:hypothetical protein
VSSLFNQTKIPDQIPTTVASLKKVVEEIEKGKLLP